MKRVVVLTSAVLGTLALGSGAWAQQERPTAPTSSADAAPAPHFVSASTLLDATATAPGLDEPAADIDDLVVDSRNGRIVYAIVDTNGVLNSDDKVVAIPYGALEWSPDTRGFTLNATAAHLAALPPCDPDALTTLADASWLSTLREVFGMRSEWKDAERMTGDEYSANFVWFPDAMISGTVVSVTRDAKTSRDRTCCAVEIETEDGARRTVFLAPAGFLTASEAMPARDAAITVAAVTGHDADGRAVHVARTVELDGSALELRDEWGIPAWKPARYRPEHAFLMLSDDLVDGTLFGRGEAFGSIDDVAFEAHSGTAALAIVSVGGVLGIDDTRYPVPWSAMTIGLDDERFIDRPVAELSLAPKLSPNGLDDLEAKAFRKRVCGYYGVKPAFDTTRAKRWAAENNPSAR